MPVKEFGEHDLHMPLNLTVSVAVLNRLKQMALDAGTTTERIAEAILDDAMKEGTE